ncbi:MAG: DUF1330 domain-containing protein [Spirochaetota bacterium]
MFEILVGVNVTDEEKYQKYRDGMVPILNGYGGQFVYDLKIAEVLKSPGNEKVNRVFTIQFPSEEKKNAFFRDTSYMQVRKEFFETSVDHTIMMAGYEK